MTLLTLMEVAARQACEDWHGARETIAEDSLKTPAAAAPDMLTYRRE